MHFKTYLKNSVDNRLLKNPNLIATAWDFLELTPTYAQSLAHSHCYKNRENKGLPAGAGRKARCLLYIDMPWGQSSAWC